MADCQNCEKLNSLKDRLERIERDVEKNTEQIQESARRTNEVTNAIFELRANSASIVATVNEMKIKIDKMTEKPAKLFDNITATIITTITGGVIGYIIFKLTGGK